MTKRKLPHEKLKVGAPCFPYTKEIAEKICMAVSVSTDSLSKICEQNPDFPKYNLIHEWRIKYPEFGDMYVQAKRNQADLLAEEIIAISDDTTHDTLIKEDKNGEPYEVCNTEWIARSKLKVDTRKWIAARLLPRIYGEKTITESTVTIKHEDAIKELK